MNTFSQGDRIIGRFDPKSVETLKPGMERWIGWEGEWEVLWEIEEEDGGSYVGDFAVGRPSLLPRNEAEDRPPFPYIWVPLCDLAEVHRA